MFFSCVVDDDDDDDDDEDVTNEFNYVNTDGVPGGFNLHELSSRGVVKIRRRNPDAEVIVGGGRR